MSHRLHPPTKNPTGAPDCWLSGGGVSFGYKLNKLQFIAWSAQATHRVCLCRARMFSKGSVNCSFL